MAARTKKLTARQVAVLEVLNAGTDECKRGMYAGRIGRLAGFGNRNRVDAGTTKTLDSLCKGHVRSKHLVSFAYDSYSGVSGCQPSRKWWITEVGQIALAEFAFGE